MQGMAEGAGGTAELDQNQELFGCTGMDAHQNCDPLESLLIRGTKDQSYINTLSTNGPWGSNLQRRHAMEDGARKALV